jgi:hypothetical protein
MTNRTAIYVIKTHGEGTYRPMRVLSIRAETQHHAECEALALLRPGETFPIFSAVRLDDSVDQDIPAPQRG